MKKRKTAPDTTNVEQYLNFESEHDREQALKVWLDAIETGVFADAVTPLRVFVELRKTLLKVSNQPAKVIPIFEQHTNGMNENEKLFIARKVLFYFRHTVFGEENQETETTLTGITKPLDAYLTRLKKDAGEEKNDAKTTELRQMLKDIFQREMARLPEYLENLDTKDRINFLCKMMPFVLPRVEAVSHGQGEPNDFGWIES